jgi:hypothetical protein
VASGGVASDTTIGDDGGNRVRRIGWRRHRHGAGAAQVTQTVEYGSTSVNLAVNARNAQPDPTSPPTVVPPTVVAPTELTGGGSPRRSALSFRIPTTIRICGVRLVRQARLRATRAVTSSCWGAGRAAFRGRRRKLRAACRFDLCLLPRQCIYRERCRWAESCRADNARSLQPYVGMTVDKAFGDGANPLTAHPNSRAARAQLPSSAAMAPPSLPPATLYRAAGS